MRKNGSVQPPSSSNMLAVNELTTIWTTPRRNRRTLRRETSHWGMRQDVWQLAPSGPIGSLDVPDHWVYFLTLLYCNTSGNLLAIFWQSSGSLLAVFCHPISRKDQRTCLAGVGANRANNFVWERRIFGGVRGFSSGRACAMGYIPWPCEGKDWEISCCVQYRLCRHRVHRISSGSRVLKQANRSSSRDIVCLVVCSVWNQPGLGWDWGDLESNWGGV